MTSTSTASTAQTPTGSEVLVEPEWLAAHLHDPGVRVVEVDVSPAAYAGGHIDGAMLWNIYQDLKDPDYRTVDAGALRRLVGRSGIDEDSTVVFYGYGPAMGFWVMKLLGHADVRILNCTRQFWEQAGLPWSDVTSTPRTTRYPARRLQERIRATRTMVQEAIGDRAWTIADVRTDLEFRGERFWPSGGLDPDGRAGHIPTSVNLPIPNVYDDNGAFRRESELREIFAALEPSTAGEVITSCTIGGRASTAWFVLSHLLGHDGVRVYDGSWAEWGRMPDTPVETSWPATTLTASR